MSREYKFRAWDKRFNIMIYQLADGYRLAFDGTIQVVGDSGSTFRVSEEFVLMQYTERKDSKGVEIYFGDTVRFTNKAEWYKSDRFKFSMRGDIDAYNEILTNHEKYPYEDRVVESIEDYEWLLSPEIQEYWEVIKSPELLEVKQ